MFVMCVLERGAMLLLLVAALATACRAEFKAACSETGRTSMSVSPSTDGVGGRYVVRYCAPVDDRVTKWDLIISSINQPQQNCSYNILEERFSGTSHSHSIEFLSPLHLNCSHVCFSKAMDLLFRSCYKVVNQLSRGQLTMEPDHDYFFADNNITKYERDIPQFVNDIDYDTSVSFHWYEGHIPITEYEIFMWPNNTHSEEFHTENVTSNCTRVTGGVWCSLKLEAGCYSLQLRHRAPWVHHFIHLATYYAHFCHHPPSLPQLSASRAAVYWAAGGGAVCAGGALVALCCWRSRKEKKSKLAVLKDWRIRQLEAEQKASQAAAEASAGAGSVLLVYARDCSHAMKLAAAVRDLLRERVQGEVYDIYSPEVTALSARSPAAWIRATLLQSACRLVLIQTPALQALHSINVQDRNDAVKLSSPLLPRRVVYRRPVFGDTLLQYTLQLLAESAPLNTTQHYNKFYLATISQLPVDLFPTIVPFTRFELPAASLALLRAICGSASETALAPDPPGASETAIQRVVDAAIELVNYVRDNPDYLASEIMFL